MNKLYGLFLLIAGTFSALIFVPRILELSKPLDYLFTALGILSAVALFLVVLKSSSKNRTEKNSSGKTKNAN